MTTTSPSTRSTSSAVPLTALRVLSALTVLSVAFQFVTAGRLFPEGGPEELHAAGAIALHVISGLSFIAAIWWWRTARGSVAVTVLAGVVFVFTFVQAATGGREHLAVHVPGAMILTVGAVWVLVASLRPGTAA